MKNNNYFHLAIINKTAGKKAYIKVEKLIKETFNNKKLQNKIIYTEYEEHAKEIISKLNPDKKIRVYVVGGDGTFNEAVNGVMSNNVELVNIPTGSGNDFNKTFSEQKDPEKIFIDSFKKEPKLVDTFLVNDMKCVNVASIGVDANVAYNVTKFKKLPFISGTLAYFISIFYTIIKYDSYKMEITIDKNKESKHLMLASFGNGRYYGSGMKAFPHAIIDDGILEVCMIEKMSRIRIIKLLKKFREGKHIGIKGIEFKRGQNIYVKSSKELNVNIDGRTIKAKELDIKIIPKDIKVV